MVQGGDKVDYFGLSSGYSSEELKTLCGCHRRKKVPWFGKVIMLPYDEYVRKMD